jgi:hypothetical protein
MTTPKRHNTAEEYPITTLMQHLQHALTPTQRERIHWLLFALLTLGTLAQTQVCLLLAQLTQLAPNTWRQRLQRLRQQPFPQQTLFPTLLRLVVEWLHLSPVFLALDATTLGNRWTVLALGVVVHHHTIPVAWKVVRGNTKGAWQPLCEALLGLLRGALPKSLPVLVLTDRGLWSPQLFGAIGRNGWHPLMRVNAQGNFRPLWGRRARALASFCPARSGLQVAIAGEAFSHRLRCRLVVFWGEGAQEPWYLLTDLSWRGVCGCCAPVELGRNGHTSGRGRPRMHPGLPNRNGELRLAASAQRQQTHQTRTERNHAGRLGNNQRYREALTIIGVGVPVGSEVGANSNTLRTDQAAVAIQVKPCQTVQPQLVCTKAAHQAEPGTSHSQPQRRCYSHQHRL